MLETERTPIKHEPGGYVSARISVCCEGDVQGQVGDARPPRRNVALAVFHRLTTNPNKLLHSGGQYVPLAERDVKTEVVPRHTRPFRQKGRTFQQLPAACRYTNQILSGVSIDRIQAPHPRRPQPRSR